MKKSVNIRSFSLSAIALLFALSLPPGFSAVADDGVAKTDDSIIMASKSYAGSEDMPDGIAFYLIASIIVGPNDSRGLEVSGFPKGSETDGAELIAEFAEIDDSASKRLFAGIAPSARELLRQSELEARKTACVPALSSWDSEKAVSVKNQLDDIREVVYEQHKIRAMNALDREDQKNFQKLLDAIKLASSYERIDYSQAYEGDLEGAKVSLLSYCNM